MLINNTFLCKRFPPSDGMLRHRIKWPLNSVEFLILLLLYTNNAIISP